MIKKYNDWLNESYGGPPSDEESFMEKYEALAIKFEKKMSINSTDFFDKIQALNLEDEINDDIEKLVSKWYDKMYVGKYNSSIDDHEMTDEWIRVKDELEKSYDKEKWSDERKKAEWKGSNWKQKRKELDEALISNLIEKHWSEYEAIYKKYLQKLHDNRGVLTSKKYGI